MCNRQETVLPLRDQIAEILTREYGDGIEIQGITGEIVALIAEQYHDDQSGDDTLRIHGAVPGLVKQSLSEES